MAYAFCLRLDHEEEAAVAALWEKLIAGGAGDELMRLGYPPHLSLAVLDDEPERSVVDAALDVMRGAEIVEIRLGGAKRFDGTSIVWLAVDGEAPLLDLHRRLMAALPEARVREHYRVGHWTPHVTLQMSGDVERALATAAIAWPDARAARFARLELVRFPPAVVLDGFDLG